MNLLKVFHGGYLYILCFESSMVFFFHLLSIQGIPYNFENILTCFELFTENFNFQFFSFFFFYKYQVSLGQKS